MAAAAANYQLSGPDAAENRKSLALRRGPVAGQHGARESGTRPYPARTKHRPLPRRTFSFISSPAAAHAPAGTAHFARRTPPCWLKSAYPDYPYLKVCKPEGLHDAQQNPQSAPVMNSGLGRSSSAPAQRVWRSAHSGDRVCAPRCLFDDARGRAALAHRHRHRSGLPERLIG